MMKRFERFSVRHPIVFGFILIVLFILLSVLAWPVSQIRPVPPGYEFGAGLAKFIIAACFLLLVWAFGWIKSSGFSSLANIRVWFWVLPLIVYKAIFLVYAFFERIQFEFPTLGVALAVLFFTFATSLLEETMYRGLLLTSMVKAWGMTRKGFIAAAIISSMFWSSAHLINMIGQPSPTVFLQISETLVSGIVYAAIVFYARSIWPVIIFHWLVNASVGLQVVQTPMFEDTMSAWLITIGITLSILPVGIYLLRKISIPAKNNEQLSA